MKCPEGFVETYNPDGTSYCAPLDTTGGFSDGSGSKKVYLGQTTTTRPPTPTEIALGKGRSQGTTTTNKIIKTVDQAVNEFIEGWINNDPSAGNVVVALVNAGRLSRTPNVTQIRNAYRSLLTTAADIYNEGKGKEFTPYDLLSLDMTTAAGDGAGSRGPQKQFVEFTDTQMKERANSAYKRLLGRAPTADEITDYAAKLKKAALANPAVTRYDSSGRVSYTTQGFDVNAWESGYLAGKIGETEADGAVGILQDQIRQIAADYGLGDNDVSRSFVARQIRDITTGDTTVESVKEVIKDLAKTKYRGLEAQIDKGMKIADLADPYITRMASIWEIPETDISVTDEVIQNALSVSDDKGNYRSLTTREFEEKLRKDPRWLKTTNAKEETLNMTNELLSLMGFRA